MNKLQEGVIIKFLDNYAFLGNMYKCNTPYLGVEYPSVENAYQAQKVLCTFTRQRFVELDPFEAKRLGRELELRKDWDIAKLDIMKELVRIKFTCNLDLREKLLLSFPKTIVADDRTEGDNTFWGKQYGKGENHLGKILMEVRKDLLFKEMM